MTLVSDASDVIASVMGALKVSSYKLKILNNLKYPAIRIGQGCSGVVKAFRVSSLSDDISCYMYGESDVRFLCSKFRFSRELKLAHRRYRDNHGAVATTPVEIIFNNCAAACQLATIAYLSVLQL